MRKNLLLLFVLLFATASCSKEGEEVNGNDKGAIWLEYSKNSGVIERTRADVPLTDFTGYTLSLNGEEVAIPADGVIGDLDPGQYEVGLTNYPSVYEPAFEDPRYGGLKSATVVSGGNTVVEMELTQENAGVFFVYDQSLATVGYENVVPSVSQSGKTLVYGDTEREAKGYFAPGQVTITMELDGGYLTIGGEASRTEQVDARQLWQITLKAGSDTNGSLTIIATVKVIEDPTDFEEFELGKGAGGRGFSFEGIADRDITVSFTDGYSETVAIDSEGKGYVRGKESGIIKSINVDQLEITVGRDVTENIALKVIDGALALRENIDGSVPVGAVSELRLIGQDAASLAASYVMESDIYMMDIPWTPIGFYSWDSSLKKAFRGVFDGAGYKIHNLNIDEPETDYVGLFAYCELGRLENIYIASGNVRGKEQVAAVVGRLEGIGTAITGCVNYASVEGVRNVAGIAAQAMVTAIDRCDNYGAVTASETAGGITAYALGQQTVISDCNNYGTINSSGAGGIVGNFSSTASVVSSNNHGVISGNTNVGGIAGNSGNYALISGCVNTASIIGTTGVGGICGINYSGTIQASENRAAITGQAESRYVGGIAGQNFQGSIYTSTNTASGIVSGFQYTGGIAGHSTQGTIQDCENHASVTGANNWAGGIAGFNNAYLYTSKNYGDVSGADYVGGIAGTNNTGITSRNNSNSGKVSGDSYVGGIAGINYGTTSGSRNSGSVTGVGDYVGGVNGLGWGQYMLIMACYNTGAVKGSGKVGGVAGGLDSDALVQAAYNVGTVSGSEYTGGVFGHIEDAYTTVENCFWGNHNGAGVGFGSADVLYFDDGTDIPEGESAGWPDETLDQWGINPVAGTGQNGMWWKHHGTRGAAQYPQLWWE